MSNTASNAVLAAAQECRGAGLCVLPAIRAEKRPALAQWKQYQQRLPTSRELEAWFKNGAAVCLITGSVSGNLEMLDFDLGGELFETWAVSVRQRAPGLLERLVIERSQSGGRHAVYRSECAVNGSMKLAQRAIETADDRPVTIHGKEYRPRKDGDRWLVIVSLIETRGEGGLFLCAPTPGYEITQGSFTDLPVLTEEERITLLDAAWQLNEWVDAVDQPVATSDGGDRPGDDFNHRGDVREILRKHGWSLVRGGENEYWRRPGKESGWSATLKDGVFYVFSSNASPFEMNRGYSPFAVYALLEHGGDFTQAASALAAEGYGQAATAPGVDLSRFAPSAPKVEPIAVRDLLQRHPTLRAPVIMGLLRCGETMNVIAPPKTGKSWLVLSLAMAVATGRPWLKAFDTLAGNVLIIDNELHAETLAHRIPQVAAALGIGMDEIAETLCVQSLRGQLRDIFAMGAYFESLEPGRFTLVVLDAFYRFMPVGGDENDNATMANIYNRIDAFADRLGCCFVLIHHTTKGNQSAKSVTDVGAGAGSQSRATDTHLVMRPHEEPGAVVLDAAVRSWPPIEPLVLRWQFPVWMRAPDLDPAALRQPNVRRSRAKQNAEDDTEAQAPQWDAESFAATFIDNEPRTRESILQRAVESGLSEWKAGRLLRRAEAAGLIYRWVTAKNRPISYAVNPPPEDEEGIA
ncbi:MAG: hypothetical protein D6760_09385 [Deltaproteobacteria bacterium]|nr:MAG: hypothetical protein D6760_09385 [Deltaproteobacteria bacterium]